MDQPVVRPLLIDRSKSNLTFSSWRLSRGAVTGVSENELEASVATTDPTELDYVNTYFSALHNNLLSGGQFVFLRKDSELHLQRLSHSASPTLTTETGGVAVHGCARQHSIVFSTPCKASCLIA